MSTRDRARPSPSAARARGGSAKRRPPARRASGGRRGPRRIRAWQWGVVLGVVVAAGVAGVVLQAGRSPTSQTKVVTPTAAMGPAGSVIEGSSSAPVLLEEYGDFQCPVCKLFHDQMDATIQALVRSGQIRFAFHPLNVIDSHAPGSTESLRAARS